MPVDTTLHERIQKLFALGTYSSNVHEAYVAMAKAQALCLKHGLALETILEAATQDVQEARVDGKTMRAPVPWERWLAQAIAPQFRCEVYTDKIQHGTRRFTGTLVFLGYPDDVAAAVATYHFAHQELEAAVTAFYKQRWDKGLRTPHPILRSFRLGFVDGLTRALTDNAAAHALACIVPAPVSDAFNALQTKLSTQTFEKYDESYAAGDARGYATGKTPRDHRLAPS